MKAPNTLDDRHEVFNMYKSLCANCRHYDGEFGCSAFPNGIPEHFLTGDKRHTTITENQTGDDVFEPVI